MQACPYISALVYMAHLSAQERQIKVMIYDSGRTMPEVAAWLGITYHTVNEYTKRIRAKYAAAGQPLPDKRRHFVTH